MFQNSISTQISYQIKRQFKVKLYETLNLVVSFGIAPLLSFLSAFIFRSNYDFVQNPSYPSFLFFMLISGVFFGLIGSVFEIIRDKPMVQRERLGGVSSFGYFISKFYVLSVFGLIQTILYNLVSMYFLHIPWELVAFNSLVMFFVVLVSIAFGLFVSSIIRSTLIASNLIPILIIPQILLGGLIPYSQMDQSIYFYEKNYDKAPPIAKFIPIMYAYESIITGNVAFTLEEHEVNDQISQIVHYLEDNLFMSIDKNSIIENKYCSVCSKTWFLDILIIIGYIISMFTIGYLIFRRRVAYG